MTWTRISDDFTDQPQVIALSDAAFRLHVEALVYSNRVNSDGLLTVAALSRLTRHDVSTLVSEMLGSGLWEAAGDCVQITDWTGAAGQLAAEEVERKKAQGRERQDRSRKHRTGDHSTCVSSYCSKAPVTRDSRVSDGDPSPPFPSLPHQGKGKEKGNSATGALAPLGALDADAQKLVTQTPADFQRAAAELLRTASATPESFAVYDTAGISDWARGTEVLVTIGGLDIWMEWANHTWDDSIAANRRDTYIGLGARFSFGGEVSDDYAAGIYEIMHRVFSKLSTILEGSLDTSNEHITIENAQRLDLLAGKVIEIVDNAIRAQT